MEFFYLNEEGLQTLIDEFKAKLKNVEDKIVTGGGNTGGDTDTPNLEGYATKEYVDEQIKALSTEFQKQIDGLKQMIGALTQSDIEEAYNASKNS